MTQTIDPLPIVAFGLASCVANTLAETQALLAENKPTLRKCKAYIDSSFRPQLMAFNHTLPLPATSQDRILELAIAALQDIRNDSACSAIPASGFDLHIVLPEPDPGTTLTPAVLSEVSAQIAQAAIDALQRPIQHITTHTTGPSGVTQAIVDAGKSATMIITADSYISRDRLNAASKRDDLFAQANPYGFIPGEGAGCILINRSTPGAAKKWVIGTGIEFETCKQDDQGQSNYSALSKAWRQALDSSTTPVTNVISDWNNNRYCAAELSYSMLRASDRLSSDADVDHISVNFGDLGAAAQMFALLMSPEGTSLLSASSRWSGQRSAIFSTW